MMRVILVLVIAASLLGFFGLHKYHTKHYAEIIRRIDKEREKNEELQRQIDFLQKKLELETMKNENERQRKLKEQQDAERAARQAAENARKAASEKQRSEAIEAKQKEIAELKERMSQLRAPGAKRVLSTAGITAKIGALQRRINFLNTQISQANRLRSDIRYACFSLCINGTDVKFTRKMTRVCRVTVSGGMYFCDHYEMRQLNGQAGSDYCTRHRVYHERHKFPNRYRDDHLSQVHYWCRQHKLVWNEQLKAQYTANFSGSGSVIGNAHRFIVERDRCRKELFQYQRDLDRINAHNKRASDANSHSQAAVDSKRQELQSQIDRLENEIKELTGTAETPSAEE
jgi:DNA repair exonuclease SbcCD ATPase subunit